MVSEVTTPKSNPNHRMQINPNGVMRLRIQSCNPLPDIKSWFRVPDVHGAPVSIYGLKEALCSSLGALKALKVTGKDLILLLDDCELLDDTPFSVVRNDDLICVKLSQAEDVKMEIGREGNNDISIDAIVRSVYLV